MKRFISIMMASLMLSMIFSMSMTAFAAYSEPTEDDVGSHGTLQYKVVSGTDEPLDETIRINVQWGTLVFECKTYTKESWDEATKSKKTETIYDWQDDSTSFTITNNSDVGISYRMEYNVPAKISQKGTFTNKSGYLSSKGGSVTSTLTVTNIDTTALETDGNAHTLGTIYVIANHYTAE